MFSLLAGVLDGVGSIYGDIDVGDQIDQAQQATVHPGLGSQPGTLNVFGSYTVNSANANLKISFDRNGVYGRLNIQENPDQSGGDIFLGGSLIVDRDPAYRPSSGSFNFLTYSLAFGDFDSFSPGDTWTEPGVPNVPLTFNKRKELNEYWLDVIPVS